MPLPLTPSPVYTPAWHGNTSVPHPSNIFLSQAYSKHHVHPPNSDFSPDQDDVPMFSGYLSPSPTNDCQLLPALGDAFMEDIEAVPSMEAIPRLRKRKMTKAQAIDAVQNVLQEVGLTPAVFLLHLLNPDTSHPSARDALFHRKNEDNISKLLTAILNDEKGSRIFKKWMAPHAIDLVCELVNKEMEAAKPSLYMTTAQTTPEFVEEWDINKIMDPVAKEITPTWSSVLLAASEPNKSHEEQARNRPTVSFVIIWPFIYY